MGEKYRPRYTQDEDGKWRDFRGRTYNRRRDALRAHADSCGCAQCQNEYRAYMEQVREDDNLVRSVVATMGIRFWAWFNPDKRRFRIDFEGDGTVYPVSKKYPDGPDVIDFDEHEDGETDE